MQTLATEQRDIEHSLEFSCFFSVSWGGGRREHDLQAFFPQKSYFHDDSLIFAIYDAEQKLGDSR